jgi:predicted SAM-dependent methyltransferase
MNLSKPAFFRLFYEPKTWPFYGGAFGSIRNGRQTKDTSPALVSESPTNIQLSSAEPESAELKLHLGCGSKYIPGFIHVDALAAAHVDHVGPVDQLGFIKDSSVALIYASHVLEHFGRHEYEAVIGEWYRKLRLGGTLRLAVPNFEACMHWYSEPGRSIEDILGLVIGGQKDRYDHHKMIFDSDLLTRALIGAGFSTVRPWDWRLTEHSHIDDFSQAYLPHLDKDGGILMSLNLEAVK